MTFRILPCALKVKNRKILIIYIYICTYISFLALPHAHPDRVTGKKARGLQTEEMGWKCQTFFSLLRARGNKQVLDISPFSI